MLRFLALSALSALLLSACDATAPAADRVNALRADAKIPLGETATLDGLAVTFERVAEDSRCPDGVMCIWEGRAVVSLVVSGPGTRGDLRADLAVAEPDHQPDAGLRVGDRILFATRLDLKPDGEARGETPVVTVATFAAGD